MTLRARLLIATCVLSLAVTVGLSLLVRRAWEQNERARFDQSFQKAVSELQSELNRQSDELLSRLLPLCTHDTAIDSALLGLATGTLPQRLLPVSLSIKEQQKALRLDELGLVSQRGMVLAGTIEGQGRQIPAELLLLLTEHAAQSRLRQTPELALEAFCKKGEDEVWVALVAAQEINPLLAAAAEHHDLSLVISNPGAQSPTARDEWTATLSLPQLGGLVVEARRSHVALGRALSQVDLSLVSAALAMLAVALGIAILLSGGLARPVVAFAARTRQALAGAAEPLPIEGGPEIEQAARAFNQTLADLQKLKERLRVTERVAARRDLARQVAHEIKNPLMPIRTSVETLQKLRATKNPLFEQYVDEALATVQSEIRRMTELVDHFAAYARLPTPHPSTFDLTQQVKSIVHLHQNLGVPVFGPDDNAPPVEVIADRDQVTQAVTNLIKNAIEAVDAVPEGRVEVTVSLQPTEAQGNALAEVVVCDNGPGVAPHLLSTLMEPYRTSKSGGTGLGLAISHRIAVEHGGDLTYTSRSGASFTLTLRAGGPPMVP